MSDHHGHGGHGQGGDGHEDVVDYSKVIGVGVASLVIFALSIWWASMIWRGKIAETEAKTGKAKTFDLKQTEIGIVDQVPFSMDGRLANWRAERKAHLEGYGWIDRSKGIVHIPIDQAVRQVASGVSPAGAPK